MAAEDILTHFQQAAQTDPEAARALVHIVIGGTDGDPLVSKELVDALLSAFLIDLLLRNILHDQDALHMARRVLCLLKAQQAAQKAREAHERAEAMGPVRQVLAA